MRTNLLLLSLTIAAHAQGVKTEKQTVSEKTLAEQAKLVVRVTEAAMLPRYLKPEQRTQIGEVIRLLREGKRKEGLAAWNGFLPGAFTKKTKGYAKRIARWVAGQSYLAPNPALATPANRVRYFDSRTRLLTTSTARLKRAVDRMKPGETAQLRPVDTKTGLMGKLRAMTTEEAQKHIADLDKALEQLGEDAQLANLKLQQALQKNQQVVQTMSNVLKTLHETAAAVTRNLK